MKDFLSLINDQTSQRIWFINCAISFNGMLSEKGKEINISSEEDWITVHNIRNSVAGICVGANTILVDNPALKTKSQYIKSDINHPVRIILDRSGKIKNSSFKVFEDTDDIPTIWVTSSKFEIDGVIKIQFKVIEEVKKLINKKLDELNRIGAVMIEGGGGVITNALSLKWINLMRIYRAPILIDNGVRMINQPIANLKFQLINSKKLGIGSEEIYSFEY